MTLERWSILPPWGATGNVRRDLEQLQAVQGLLHEIQDTGTANTQVTIRHNLGRMPRGMRIINCVTASTPGSIGWYRLDPDDVWDSRDMRLRFLMGNARVLMEIF